MNQFYCCLNQNCSVDEQNDNDNNDLHEIIEITKQLNSNSK